MSIIKMQLDKEIYEVGKDGVKSIQQKRGIHEIKIIYDESVEWDYSVISTIGIGLIYIKTEIKSKEEAEFKKKAKIGGI